MIHRVPPGLSRAAAATGAAVLLVTLAGCSSAKHSGASEPTASPATRWWSNSAVTVGSTIDAAAPTKAAHELSPSRADYCGMLKQTLALGKSLLPTAGSVDPRLASTSQAFVAEIEAVAPAPVQAPWHVLGPVILSVVRSGGSLPTATPAQTAANLKAAEAINADAKAGCKLDLSGVVAGG